MMATTDKAIRTDENPKRRAEPFVAGENLARLARAARDMDAGRNCAEHEQVEADESETAPSD